MQPHPGARIRGADFHEGDHVRLCSPLWRGAFGVVAYVGCDLIEVELPDGAIVSFLPCEVEPRDTLRAVEVRDA